MGLDTQRWQRPEARAPVLAGDELLQEEAPGPSFLQEGRMQ